MSTVPFSRRNRPSATFDKPLPNNIDAERTVLGAILVDDAVLGAVIGSGFAADDFFHQHHRKIYSAMLLLTQTDKTPVDLITLSEKMSTLETLEGVGGAAYLASLADGMPRLSNVEHYCNLIREKARLRDFIQSASSLMETAWDGVATAEDLWQTATNWSTDRARQGSKNKLVAVDLVDFLDMDVSPVEFVMYPILPVKGIGMFYAARGAGKTFVSLECAYCIAKGIAKCFQWDIPKQRPVVYVDGEMDQETLQERLRELARGHRDGLPDKGFFKLITPDLQKGFMPRINTRESQLAIEEHLQPGHVLWLDNLASLCPVSQEDETGDWIMVQDWLLSLRRKGITTMFDHHAGKSGAQRGSSVKEDVLNVVINLRRGEGYQMEQQLCAEVHLEKVRGKAAVGNAVQPFEVTLRTDNGEAEWLMRPLKHIIEKRAFEMFENGMKPNDVAQDLRLSRFQVYRLKRKFDGGTRADNYLPDEN